MSQYLIMVIKFLFPFVAAGLVTYYFNKHQQKLNIQLKVSDEIINCCNEAIDALNSINVTSMKLYFSQYQNAVQTNFHIDNPMNVKNIILESSKQIIVDYIAPIPKQSMEYQREILKIIRLIESKMYILDGFKIFNDKMIANNQRLRDNNSWFIDTVYNFGGLSKKINSGEQLDVIDFDHIDIFIKSFDEFRFDMICLLCDLQNEVQRKFYKPLWWRAKNIQRDDSRTTIKVTKIDKTVKW